MAVHSSDKLNDGNERSQCLITSILTALAVILLLKKNNSCYECSYSYTFSGKARVIDIVIEKKYL